MARVFPEEPSVTDRLSGLLIGVEVGAAVGRFSMSARYSEGTVKSTRLDVSQDVVDGEFLLGLSLVEWLTVKFGPHVRSFTFSDGARRRWLFWEGRVRAEARLFDRWLRSYAEGWRAFGADVSGPDPFKFGQGAEAGLEGRLATSPFWARIGYRIERSALTGVTASQIVEQILIGVGVSR